MSPTLTINDRSVGEGHSPFIIAEMSGNHNQSLERALQIVEAAAASGAHALKIQTYTADTMTLDIQEREFMVSDPASLWRGESLYALYKKAYTPWEWHETIFKRCQELGLIGFSSPFDVTAVDFLERLNVPCYKIASFENVDIPLIRRVAATGKPVIISTGMATESEIEDAVQTVRKAGKNNLLLLKCTSNYPAPPEESNLLTIPAMARRFECPVGLSDHTMGIGVSVGGVALGAVAIEKHFTLARADGGVDAAFSLEPAELKSLAVESERAWKARGQVRYGATERESKSLQYRRSLYVAQDMKVGDIFTSANLRAIRPGLGLPPKHYDAILGRSVRKDVHRGTPVSWDLVS